MTLRAARPLPGQCRGSQTGARLVSEAVFSEGTTLAHTHPGVRARPRHAWRARVTPPSRMPTCRGETLALGPWAASLRPPGQAPGPSTASPPPRLPAGDPSCLRLGKRGRRARHGCGPPRGPLPFPLWRAHRESPEACTPQTADVRADRPRCLPWSSALLCANSFRPSAEIVTSRGGASSCCPPAPGLADKPQPEANVCLLRRREGGGSGLRRGPRAGSHLSRQPHARQESGSSSQPLGEWGRLPALTARQGPGTPPSRPVSASVALPGGSGNLTALARLRRLLPWLDTFRGG